MSSSSTPSEQTVAVRPEAPSGWSVLQGIQVPAGILYAGAILVATLTLHPYFSETWDVATFIQAAQRLLGGGNPFDLYAQSRAAQTWPYAYPPLHAAVVAAALLLSEALHVLPDFVWARVPPLLADIGVALVLYDIVLRRSADRSLARMALLLWLFNPVTFYDTAVQGHFESEWLLFVLLAYAWHESSRNLLLPTAALGAAVLFKQIAILFALPLWLTLVLSKPSPTSASNDEPATSARRAGPLWRNGNWRALAASLLLFAAVVALVCLPFLLYSNDFLFMNLTYVENVPVQTQSWIVMLLGLTRATPQALDSAFVLIRYQAIATFAAAAIIALIGTRRGWSLYLTGALIVLAFFLTSKKVMGYYYVMLLPFLFAECLPRRRFGLVLAVLGVVTWISLSPYYAVWSNPDHWWLYGLLGVLNSLFFVWLFLRLVSPEPPPDKSAAEERKDASGTLFVSMAWFASAVAAAVVQPLVHNTASPIRPPIFPVGSEWNSIAAFGALVALCLLALAGLARWTRLPSDGPLPRQAWTLSLVFLPLFFAVYSLTKEPTAIFEIMLKSLGV